MMKNTPNEYGAVSKFLHWTIGLAIVGMLALGYIMEDFEDLDTKIKAFGLHKSVGISILTLAVLRIIWHAYSRRPLLIETGKAWEKLAAETLHFCLYCAMLVMPLTGWLVSSSAGRPVSFFGLFTLPDLIGADESMKEIFEALHEFLAVCLIAGISVHVLAALKHHFLNKDATLTRMLPDILTKDGGVE